MDGSSFGRGLGEALIAAAFVLGVVGVLVGVAIGWLAKAYL